MQIRVREMETLYSGKPCVIPGSQPLDIHNLLPLTGLLSFSSSVAVGSGLEVT